MAPNALFAIALVAALGLGGCSAGEDENASRVAEAQLAALKARTDSLRAARQAAAADSAATAPADSAAQSTLAATTPGADSARTLADTVTPSEAQSLLADSIRKAREIEVMREVFAYGGGIRDPFASLINKTSTGPEIGDLDLVGVYQDLGTRSNSVIVVREKVTSKRHKLRVGDHVGRARLIQIRPRAAVFTVQDFGYERQETLSLRKQEVETP